MIGFKFENRDFPITWSNRYTTQITGWNIKVQFLAGRRNYALLQNIQIGFGAHPLFYSFGRAGTFSRDKAVRARN